MVIPSVYAEDNGEVNLADFPTRLSEMLMIPLIAAQILASTLVISLFLFPTLLLCAKFNKDVLFPSLFVGLTTLAFCIALDWLQFWYLLIIVLFVALLYAGAMRDWITGRGRG